MTKTYVRGRDDGIADAVFKVDEFAFGAMLD
jgi:hypothetical protein